MRALSPQEQIRLQEIEAERARLEEENRRIERVYNEFMQQVTNSETLVRWYQKKAREQALLQQNNNTRYFNLGKEMRGLREKIKSAER